MPKILPLSARKIIKILTGNGFVVETQRGSHIKLKKRDGGTVHTVIVPNYPEIGPMVINSIIRQSGLPKELFRG
jgi:predicted RNA binding protein YcfA (HicA-like mRNA interferase family)